MKNIADMPLFHQMLTEPNLTRFDRPYTPARIERLNEALAQWDQAMKVGEIENARFNESKSDISRAVEDAWQRVPRDSKWIWSLPEAERNALDTVPTPTLANLSGRVKRILKAPEHPTRERLIAFIQDVAPVLEAYTFLKTHAKKRVPRTAEEIEATRFVPPPSSSKAVAQVQALLEGVVDRDYLSLLADLRNQNRHIIEKFLACSEKAQTDESLLEYPGTTYSPRWHFTVKSGNYRRRVTDSQSAQFLEKVLKYEERAGLRGGVYQATKETWALADADAEKAAQLIRQHFIFKNLKKLTPILELKGEDQFKEATEVGSKLKLRRLEGDFHFAFHDGSSFDVHNAVVYVVNQFETRFYRYPLTFHSVVLPDGKPMPGPSEERMHETFAVARGEAKGAPVHGRTRRSSP